MTKIENLKVLIISFILISLTFIVQAKDLKIAYLDLTDDPRYDENLIYARIQLKPTGRPLIAAKIAEGLVSAAAKLTRVLILGLFSAARKLAPPPIEWPKIPVFGNTEL